MRYELIRVSFEAEKGGTVGVHVDSEFLLDALPSSEIRRIGVAILPDGAPRGEYGLGRHGSDLGRGRGSGLEDAANHKGV